MAGARLGGQEDRICYQAENILVHYLLTHSLIHSCIHAFIHSIIQQTPTENRLPGTTPQPVTRLSLLNGLAESSPVLSL